MPNGKDGTKQPSFSQSTDGSRCNYLIVVVAGGAAGTAVPGPGKHRDHYYSQHGSSALSSGLKPKWASVASSIVIYHHQPSLYNQKEKKSLSLCGSPSHAVIVTSALRFMTPFLPSALILLS